MHIFQIKGDLLNQASDFRELVRQSESWLKSQACTMLLSGRSSTINKLTEIAQGATQTGSASTEQLSILEKDYLNLAREIVPVIHQGATLSFIRKQFNDVDDLCKGIQLLGECPEKALRLIQSMPALIMVQLLHAACMAAEIVVSTTLEASEKKNGLYLLNDNQQFLHELFQQTDISIQHVSCMVPALPFVTADHQRVKHARHISCLSHDEAIELSRHTSNSINPDLIAWAGKRRLNISIKTICGKTQQISDSPETNEQQMITGITAASGYDLISIEGNGMIGVPGFAQRVFDALYRGNVNISLISQGASEHAICVAVKDIHAADAVAALSAAFEIEIGAGILKSVHHLPSVALIELIGENMRNHPGISGRMFSALGNNGINILAIAQGSNERNISVVVKASDNTKALNVLHEAFFEHAYREVNLFIAGTGNVGKKLINQVISQLPILEERQHIRIVLAGICNSRKMLIKADGIQPEKWESLLDMGEKSAATSFVDNMISLNLRNSVLVDVTAHQDYPGHYARILKKSMSVVACNKIAASDRFEKYRELNQLAISYNCKFLFETNVGAALPVIGTLNDLIRSGDRIARIEAVLSGTLNYVFNHYDGSRPFAEVVKSAQAEGYTEPDPRLDLSGTDVMRKIMILAREGGEELEMEDIACNGFLPEACRHGSVVEFYESLQAHEAHFSSLLDAARADNAKLKFVATFSSGKASVGLQHIKPDSEMYHLYGKDNIVLFYTDRYAEQPLVVKGAGAGAAVTASGVFADILRTINR
jgi:aspartokinase/homoserine dehydrogenase 1